MKTSKCLGDEINITRERDLYLKYQYLGLLGGILCQENRVAINVESWNRSINSEGCMCLCVCGGGFKWEFLFSRALILGTVFKGTPIMNQLHSVICWIRKMIRKNNLNLKKEVIANKRFENWGIHIHRYI